MSDRGIPRTLRHMHGFGSHTFSMINAANERVWVKFHFRTQQGIENLTDEEAAALIAVGIGTPKREPGVAMRRSRGCREPTLQSVYPRRSLPEHSASLVCGKACHQCSNAAPSFLVARAQQDHRPVACRHDALGTE
jgi:hypothetical protein